MMALWALLMLQDAAAFEAVADKLRSACAEGKFEEIQALYDAGMASTVTLEQTRAVFSEMLKETGPWKGREDLKVDGGTATFTARCERGSFEVVLTLTPDKKIAGLFLRPVRRGGPVAERNATVFSLPITGEWFVFWGGDTKELNYHVINEAQRRAFDWVAVDEKGVSHRGDGKRNEDYYVWGREILAPADGLVVEAIDGVRDNEPGKKNPYSTVGNAVTLEHAPNEFSLLAHFRRGTVRVKAGDRVKRGDVLGLCGNSGNSSEPHLHFHLMHRSVMAEAKGVKIFFERVRVTRDGKTEERADYSPIKGDRISP